MSSIHRPVPDPDDISDDIRAAIGTVVHQPSMAPASAPPTVSVAARELVDALVHQLAPPSTNGKQPAGTPATIHHTVQAPAQPPSPPPPPGALARLRLLGARTDVRMRATIGWLPVWLAVSTVVAMYLLSEPVELLTTPGAPLVYPLGGLAAGLLVWVATAAATNGDALVSRANPRSYADLVGRMDEAEARIECRVAAGRLAQDAAPVVQLGVLKGRLQAPAPDPDWSSGLGYVNAWRDLHRIEEGLIEVADEDELDGVLRHDEQRIEGSKLDQKESGVRKLVDQARSRLGGALASDSTSDGGSSKVTAGKQSDPLIRSLLHAIRAAVNDFRDRRFEALVRNRIYVDRVSLVLGATAWALLCLAILTGADPYAVAGASALYLIGAAAGLFTQLRSGMDETLEDVFGYGQATLRQTVLVSGLAAVAGVFLTAALRAGTTADVDVTTVFAFSGLSAVTAAAFGAAPGLLTGRLNAWAKTNIEDLESTTAATS